MCAPINEIAVNDPINLPKHVTRNTHTAGCRHFLQTRGNIDSVPVNIFAINQQITKVDTDTESNSLIFRNFGIPQYYAFLNENSALNSVNDAIEFNQNSVAHLFDNPTAVLADCWVNDGKLVFLERS
jgi:hypothetical protein